jgi:hypothetical protein
MQPVFIIKPNVKKVCIMNVLKVAAAATIIIAVVTYSRYIIDFSVFSDVFGFTEQDTPSGVQVIANFALGVLFASLVAFILSYLSASKRQYVFFPDHVEIYTNFLIFNLAQRQIPLANVVSVRAVKEGEQKLFGMGRIVLELTAMNEKQAELDDIDQPEYYVPYVQNLLNNVRAQFDTQFKFKATIDRTMSGL